MTPFFTVVKKCQLFLTVFYCFLVHFVLIWLCNSSNIWRYIRLPKYYWSKLCRSLSSYTSWCYQFECFITLVEQLMNYFIIIYLWEENITCTLWTSPLYSIKILFFLFRNDTTKWRLATLMMLLLPTSNKSFRQTWWIILSSPWTQDMNWRYIRRSEDILDIQLCMFSLSFVCRGLYVFGIDVLSVIDAVLKSLLLTLSRFHTLFWCFHSWLWTSKCVYFI